MESLECPNCGLLNPAGNDRCDDCASSFEVRKTGRLRRLYRKLRGRWSETSTGSVVVTASCGLFLFSPVIALASLLIWSRIPLIPCAVAEGAIGGDSADRAPRGYEINRDLLGRERSRFKIRDGDATTSCQSFVELTKVRNVVWIADDRGLVIDFEVAFHDSGPGTSEYAVRLLYDFEQKRLYGHNDQAYECEGPAGRERLDEAAFQTLVDSYE